MRARRGANLDLKRAILNRIRRDKSIVVWSPNDFLDLGARSAVDKALQRLTDSGDLRRIDRGLYDLPRVNTKRGLITAFLALLELTRLKAIFLMQDRPFGEITAHANPNYELSRSFTTA